MDLTSKLYLSGTTYIQYSNNTSFPYYKGKHHNLQQPPKKLPHLQNKPRPHHPRLHPQHRHHHLPMAHPHLVPSPHLPTHNARDTAHRHDSGAQRGVG